MKLKNTLILSAAVLVIGFAAIGRYNANQILHAEKGSQRISRGHERSLPVQDGSISDSEKAEKIAEALMHIDEIKSASVIIIGGTAIVGVEAAGELSGSMLAKVKKRVEKESLGTVSTLERAAVTFSEELVSRIKENADYTAIADYSWSA